MKRYTEKVLILDSHTSGIAAALKQGLGFHQAFAQVTGDFYCDSDIPHAKREHGRRLAEQSIVSRRNKMVRESTTEKPRRKYRAVSMHEQMMLIDTHPLPD